MFDTCRLFPPVGDPQPSCMLPSHHLLFDYFQFTLIRGPNIPGSYAILATYAKSWLIGKDSDAGRDWGQKEKWTTEDEMAVWHHQLSRCEFEQTPGEEQGSLACCRPWGHKELDITVWLNNDNNSIQNNSIQSNILHSEVIHSLQASWCLLQK